MIYDEITKSAFRDRFRAMGRADNFSYQALGALYDYLQEWSESTGEPIILDVIGICCDYVEVRDLDELASEYGIDVDDVDSIGTLIPFEGGWILEHGS